MFRLNWQELDILVNGFNSKESVPPQQVEVNAFAEFDLYEHSLSITPFVKESLLVGSKTIGIPILHISSQLNLLSTKTPTLWW